MKKFFWLTLFLLIWGAACMASPVTPPQAPVVVADVNSSVAALTDEGNLLLTKWQSDQVVLYQVDPRTWAEVTTFAPIALGEAPTYIFSPDKQSLAGVHKPPRSQYVLGFIDLKTWQMHTIDIGAKTWVSTIVYSPDGKQLAFTYSGELERGTTGRNQPKDYQLVVVDVPARSVMAQVSLDFSARFLAYTADSQQLVAFGGELKPQNPEKFAPAQAAMFRSSDLHQLWEHLLVDVVDGNYEGMYSDNMPQLTSWQAGVAFSPTDQKLYVVHANEDRLTTVDFANRSANTLTIQPVLSWIEQLLAWDAGIAEAKIYNGTTKQATLSADGQKLYLIGHSQNTWLDDKEEWQFEETPLGLTVIEVATGKELAQLDTAAQRLQWSADRQYLYLHKWGFETNEATIELIDAGTLTRIAQSNMAPASQTWLTNGDTILLSHQEERNGFRFSILDPQTLETINSSWIRGNNLFFVSNGY